jgi:ABC-2 type transport system ATP-binding protein
MDAVTITKLQKRYAGGLEALKGISLRVKQGCFFGLLGPNGAGKTTTIGILTNLVNKTTGTVRIFGKAHDSVEARRNVGLVPQEFNFSIFEKVIDIIVQQAGYYGIPRDEALASAEEHLKRLGLWEKRETQARHLSGGMKRKLMIARALVHRPRLLILDEPTAGVDVETRREMWEYLRELNTHGVTVILTTHYIEEAEELCTELGIINKGEIITQTSKKNLLKELQEQTYILDLEKMPKQLPPGCEQLDETSVKVLVNEKRTINNVVKAFDKKRVTITSMRNERNRLEELFVRLTR